MALLPTPRAAALLAAGLLPAIAASLLAEAPLALLLLDVVVLCAVALDAVRAPGPASITVRRELLEPLPAGRAAAVSLELQRRTDRPLALELADDPPPTARLDPRRFPLTLLPRAAATLTYRILPRERGDLAFGDLHVRAPGPWGLAARQWRVPAARTVRVFPALGSAAEDAALFGRLAEEASVRRARRARGDGREFESLRPYAAGDDLRAIDWKASARRGALVSRNFQPEKNQSLVLVLDAGRHMTAASGETTRFSDALTAALRLARVALERGDVVQLCAVADRLVAIVPAAKGRAQLRRLVDATYRLQPSLTETDWALAIDHVRAHEKRRALVVLFTELVDEESAQQLVGHLARLRPRHLPLVVAAEDEALEGLARGRLQDPSMPWERLAALRLQDARRATSTRLVSLGAHLVRARTPALATAAVAEYLSIKGRGLL